MAVRYKNKKTDKIATYSQRIPRLEKSKNWERVADKQPSSRQSGKQGNESDG